MTTDTGDNMPICAICRDSIECDFLTRCGHHFHESCLNAITNPYICPYCQQPISRNRWREKILCNTKNLDEETREEIYGLLRDITCIDVSTGAPLKHTGPVPIDKNILENLTKVGWDINSPEEGGRELLERVCKSDDLYRLNLLLEFGLRLDDNIDLLQKTIKTAEEHGSILVAERLNDYVYECFEDGDGNTAIHIFANQNDLETIKYCISKGDDVNIRNANGETPLHFAAYEGNLEIVSYLLDNGALIDCHDIYGYNPLFDACRSDKEGSVAVIRKLIESGARTDFLDNDKNTLLHCVLIGRKYDVAEELLSIFPEINQPNVYKETCLHLAAIKGPKSFLEKMIEAGADVNAKDYNGNTPLHKALMKNYPEVVEFLLQKGADVNASNNKSEYPIHIALKRIPSLSFVQILVKHGADLGIKDSNGKSIVELALQSNY